MKKIGMAESPKPALQVALERLGKTLKLNEPANDCENVTSLRTPPPSENQPDFFVPALHDIPIKDGVDLMDVALFRLSKTHSRKGDIIRYQVKDTTIEVSGGGHGMATIDDYDIVLMVISYLQDRTQKWKDGRGEKPPRILRISSYEVLKFCRKNPGGRDYDLIAGKLDRLQGTFIKIIRVNNKTGNTHTSYFPLLAGAEIVSRTKTGKIGLIDVHIPDWIYERVVVQGKPKILTYNPDYWLLKKGLDKFLYRFARKVAGQTEARYRLRTVYHRSGTTRAYKKFKHDIKLSIKRGPLLDYSLELEDGVEGPILSIRRSCKSSHKIG